MHLYYMKKENHRKGVLHFFQVHKHWVLYRGTKKYIIYFCYITYKSKDFSENLSHQYNITIKINYFATKKKRSLTSKLRLGTLDLEIEINRKHKIPREERFCKLCETGEVENEVHFILNCPILSQCREPFLNMLTLKNKHFPQFSPDAKIKYLYFNESLPKAELAIAADMLESLKYKRDALLG